MPQYLRKLVPLNEGNKADLSEEIFKGEKTYVHAQSGNFASCSARVSISSSTSPSPAPPPCLRAARPTTLAVSSPFTSENASSSLIVWLSLSRVRREEAIEVVSSSRFEAEYTEGVWENP